VATITERKSYRVKVRLKGYRPKTFDSRFDAEKWASQTESEILKHHHFKAGEADRHNLTTIQERTAHQVKIRMKGHPPQSATFARLTEARKWEQQTESAIREGRYFKTVEAKRHTLGELIERYRVGVLPSKKDAAQQARQLAWWQSRIGSRLLSDLGAPILTEQRDILAAGTDRTPAKPRTQATVNRYLAALSHVFTIAVQQYEWMTENPLRRVNRGQESRGRVRFLSDAERERLLTACRDSGNPDLYIAVVLSLATGARRMEVLGLRWPQVDLARNVIALEETKNGERRSLPIGDTVRDLLKARAKVRRIDSDLVFPGRSANRPAQLRHAWLIALKAAAVEDFHWHDLRHSAASYLAMNGASIQEIAAVLGHKTLAMVKRYAHLSEQHTANVVNRMNRAIFGK
jgi:integrase